MDKAQGQTSSPGNRLDRPSNLSPQEAGDKDRSSTNTASTVWALEGGVRAVKEQTGDYIYTEDIDLKCITTALDS